MRRSIEGTDPFKIEMDRAWSLDDLYIFPRNFEQVYFFFYSLELDHDEDTKDRIEYTYKSLPWQGGYSAVSFYNQLKYIVPKPNRPTLISMQYASPGWMEISLYVSVALNIGTIVKFLS